MRCDRTIAAPAGPLHRFQSLSGFLMRCDRGRREADPPLSLPGFNPYRVF